MKRSFFLLSVSVFFTLLFTSSAFAKALPYPAVKRIKWLNNKTEVIVPIPSFFKRNKGVLVTEKYGKNVSTFSAHPITSDTISLQFELFSKDLGLAPGKYTVKFSFCKEGVKKINKKDCGRVLKKKITYK